MLDFQEMQRRQREGLQEVASLEEDEREVLQHYCSLAAEALLKMGAQRKASLEGVALNSYKNGIALGLRLAVVGGELRGR